MPFINKATYFLVIGVLVFGSIHLKAQNPPYLEKLVTINVSNMEVADVFKSITFQTSSLFSYTKPFNDKQRISINFYKKPLRLVLDEILKTSGCTYKLKDKYIIIKCTNKPTPSPFVVKGYVYNAGDSSAIPEASIYVKQTKHSAISNEYGFFTLSYSNSLPAISVSFAKEHYKDTVVAIYNQPKKEIVLYLYPIKAKKDSVTEPLAVPIKDSIIPEKKDSVILAPKSLSKFWEKFQHFNTNFRNISDTLFSTMSVSLIPYVGTNRLLSINTVNKVSFNILAGYSKGVNGFELGGLLNIDHGNVQFGQVAGLGNIVSGNVKGIQAAGLFNVNGKSTTGTQLSGIISINKGNTKGIQLSGIGNVNSGTTEGMQAGGVFNTSKQQTRGMQIAGIFNTTSSIKGMQIASILNHADTVKGVQIAGLINTSKCNNGMQIAGLVNHTHYLKGVQLSLVNLADTASGVPIGLFNFVKKGYHKLEIACDELSFGTVAFATGVNRLHTFFIAGVNYNNPKILTYGYGLGTSLPIKKKWNLSASLTSQQLQQTEDVLTRNLLHKLFIGVEYQACSKFSIGIGPTFNLFMADTTAKKYTDTYSKISSYNLYDHTIDHTNLKMWVGAKIFVRFF